MNELVNRIFKIWAYTVSHSFLILRSPLKFPDQEGYNENLNYNIDVEFSAVAYVDIPTTLNGIEIRELIDDVPKKFQSYKTEHGFKIFELKSNQDTYYIVAGSYRIGRNQWISDNRVLNMNLVYESIITTS